MSAGPFGGFADVTIVTFVFLGRRADLISAQGGAQTVPTNTGSIRRRADELNRHLFILTGHVMFILHGESMWCLDLEFRGGRRLS